MYTLGVADFAKLSTLTCTLDLFVYRRQRKVEEAKMYRTNEGVVKGIGKEIWWKIEEKVS